MYYKAPIWTNRKQIYNCRGSSYFSSIIVTGVAATLITITTIAITANHPASTPQPGEGGPSGFGLTEKYPYFYASNPFQWSVLIRCNLADSSSPKLAKSLQTDHTFKRIHYTDLHFLGNKRIKMKMSGKGSMLLNSNYWFWETTMFCDIHWQI